ncbi:MAG: hypothetical protein IAE84_01650 [Saprospiraceae bacterium]|jgi:hypothetical protein|nr:hypothetical protein [Saprospiraceae bacterium]
MAAFIGGPGQVHAPGQGRSFASPKVNLHTQDNPQPFIGDLIEWILEQLIGSDDTTGFSDDPNG